MFFSHFRHRLRHYNILYIKCRMEIPRFKEEHLIIIFEFDLKNVITSQV